MPGGRHPCTPPASKNALQWRSYPQVREALGESPRKPAASSLVTATPDGVGSETRSRHRAYGNVDRSRTRRQSTESETRSRHRAYGNRIQKNVYGYFVPGPKQGHAIGRMETEEI